MLTLSAPSFPERASSKASAACSSGNRWVSRGRVSTSPRRTRFMAAPYGDQYGLASSIPAPEACTWKRFSVSAAASRW